MGEQLEEARSIALQAMVDGLEKLVARDSPVVRQAIGWRGGDHTCDVVGDQIMGDDREPAGETRDLDLYIATQVYEGGGHTAVIGDFVRASSSARAEVIVTGTVERDIHGGGIPPEIIPRLGVREGDLDVCPHENRAAATRWLMGEIRARRPRRVFLFHHPQDAVAIAAARPSLCGEGLYLVHHADRQPTLGLHQRGTRVVDLSPFTGEFTRRVLDRPCLYAPLIVNDPGALQARAVKPPLTTASSGSAHKFGEDYAHNVARILQTTGGRHHHIGFMKKERLEKIRQHLNERGLDPEQFKYLEWVPSLAAAFVELKVDLCIGSAPMGGARTAIEACAAGVPMIAHHPEYSTRFGITHVIPETWPIWRNAGELVAILEAASADWITAQRALGREFYERNHHPDQLRRALADLDHSQLPARDDLPMSELLDQEKLATQLSGEWAFLRSEFPAVDWNSSSGRET